jgi:predicted NAD-dependent protein-ADP-ribosyltransferase YbiA (DUF1768 family)
MRNLSIAVLTIAISGGMLGCRPAPVLNQPAEENASGLRDGRYPARWWEPVSREGAPAWEIFPQEAGPGEVILSKRNELGLLSNFAATPFVFHGKKYASVEGFWQMMKYPDGPEDERGYTKGVTWKFTREQVGQLTGFDANHAGKLGDENMKQLGIDWVTFEGKRMTYRETGGKKGEHYQLIVEAMREKVRQNPEVNRVLMATGDLVLRPDHHQDPDAPPEWRYEIMMEIRQGQKMPEKPDSH